MRAKCYNESDEMRWDEMQINKWIHFLFELSTLDDVFSLITQFLCCICKAECMSGCCQRHHYWQPTNASLYPIQKFQMTINIPIIMLQFFPSFGFQSSVKHMMPPPPLLEIKWRKFCGKIKFTRTRCSRFHCVLCSHAERAGSARIYASMRLRKRKTTVSYGVVYHHHHLVCIRNRAPPDVTHWKSRKRRQKKCGFVGRGGGSLNETHLKHWSQIIISVIIQ